LKALLRAAATRTIPDLWDTIRDAIASPHRTNVETISPLQGMMNSDQKAF
jgi:hypothetical protein